MSSSTPESLPPRPGLSAWMRGMNMLFRWGVPTVSPLPGVEIVPQVAIVRTDRTAIPAVSACGCNKAKLLRATVCIALEMFVLLAIHKKGLPSQVTRVMSQRHVKYLTSAVALFCLFKVILKTCPHLSPEAPVDPQHQLNVSWTFSLRPDKLAQWALGKLGGLIWPGSDRAPAVSSASSPVNAASAADEAGAADNVPAAAPDQQNAPLGDQHHEDAPSGNPSGLSDASAAPPPSPKSPKANEQPDNLLQQEDAPPEQATPVSSPSLSASELSADAAPPPSLSPKSPKASPRLSPLPQPLDISSPLSPIISPRLSPVNAPDSPKAFSQPDALISQAPEHLPHPSPHASSPRISPPSPQTSPPPSPVLSPKGPVPLMTPSLALAPSPTPSAPPPPKTPEQQPLPLNAAPLTHVPPAANVSAVATAVLNPPAQSQQGMFGQFIGFVSDPAVQTAFFDAGKKMVDLVAEVTTERAKGQLLSAVLSPQEDPRSTRTPTRITPPPANVTPQASSTSQEERWFATFQEKGGWFPAFQGNPASTTTTSITSSAVYNHAPLPTNSATATMTTTTPTPAPSTASTPESKQPRALHDGYSYLKGAAKVKLTSEEGGS